MMDLNSIYIILAYTALGSYLFPILYGVRNINFLTPYTKIFWIGSICSFVFFGLSFLLFYLKINSTLYLTYLSTFVGVVIKLLFFRKIIKNKIAKLLITILGIIVIVIDISEAVYTNLFGMNNITAFFEYGWVIIATVYCLRNLLNINIKKSIRIQSVFWIFIGLLVYVFFSLMFDTFSNQLLKYSNQFFTIFALLIYITVIISNLFYAIAIHKAKIYQTEQIPHL